MSKKIFKISVFALLISLSTNLLGCTNIAANNEGLVNENTNSSEFVEKESFVISEIYLKEEIKTSRIETLYTGQQETIEIIAPKQEGKTYVQVLLHVNEKELDSVTFSNGLVQLYDGEKLIDNNEQLIYEHYLDSLSYREEGWLVFEVDTDKIEEAKLVFNGQYAQNLEVGITDEMLNEVSYPLNIVDLQKNINKSILSMYENGDYTLENPLIINNPYETTPLTAMAIFKLEKEENITVEIVGKDGEENISYVVENVGSGEGVPIYWLYEDYENTVLLSDTSNNKTELKIQTDPQPSRLDNLSFDYLVEPEGSQLIHVNPATNQFVVDNYGNIRWYSTINTGQGGSFLGQDEFLSTVNDEIIYNTNFLGHLTDIYDAETLHHDVQKTDDGKIIALSADSVIVYDDILKQNIATIDYADVLDENRQRTIDAWQYPVGDWLHSNSNVYDKDRNAVLISSRNQSAVISYDLDTNEVNWILGDHSNWDENLQKALLTPIGDEFEWQWAQHALQILPDFDENIDTIDLLLFDNGNYRTFDESEAIAAVDNYSRGVWYRINTVDMTVEQMWQYGKERGSELYSNVVSDVDYIVNGDVESVLINFGSMYRDNDDVATDLVAGTADGSRHARILEVDMHSNELLFELAITEKTRNNFGAYRAEKLNVTSIETIDLSTSNEIEEHYLYDTEAVASNKNFQLNNVNTFNYLINNESIRYNIDELSINNDGLLVRGWIFKEGIDSSTQKFNIILKSDNGYYTNNINVKNVVSEDVAAAFNSDLYNNARYKHIFDLTALPSGTYDIMLELIVDDNSYLMETGKYFTKPLDADNVSVTNNDWLTNQQQVTENLANVNYTNDIQIVQNPYGISPLTAVAYFKTDAPAKVSIVVQGKAVNTFIKHDFEEYNTQHMLPIYGLYANIGNTVEFHLTYEDGTTESKQSIIHTDELPTDMFITDVNVKTESETNNMMFVSSTYLAAIDANGEVRWYIDDSVMGAVLGTAAPIKRLENNNLLVPTNKLARTPYYATGFYELDLLGRIYSEFAVEGTHHEIIEKADGNFIVASEQYGTTIEDYIVEIHRETGEVVRDWDLRQVLNMETIVDENYKTALTFDDTGKIYGNDWFHNNGLSYIEGEDTLIVSGRTQDMVFKFNCETEEVIWVLSDPNDEFPEHLEEKLLTPVGEGFEYQYGQHAPELLPNGDLLLFDNGNFRSKDAENIVPAENNYSRAVVYRIDEENLTVEQVWQYGKERGSELFSAYVGDADYIGENHYLINFGGTIIDENENRYSRPDDLFADPNAKGISHIIEIKDDVIVQEFKLTSQYVANTYRAELMPLYFPQQGYIDLDKVSNYYGQLHTTPITDVVVDSDGIVNAEINLIADEGDRYVIKADVPKPDEYKNVYIVLSTDSEELIYKANVFSTLASVNINKIGLDDNKNYKIGIIVEDNNNNLIRMITNSNI